MQIMAQACYLCWTGNEGSIVSCDRLWGTSIIQVTSVERRNREIAGAVSGKEGRSIEDKPGIKVRIGNRNGEWISRKKESKMETKEERKGAWVPVPFGGPSASERLVISFYIHPTRFESLLFRFQPSYLLLTALTLCEDCATEFRCYKKLKTKFFSQKRFVHDIVIV